MNRHESLDMSLPHLPSAIGYSLTSTWATVLLFSSFFSATPTPTLVTMSMLSGVVACLGALFLHSKVSFFNGRSGISSIYATGIAVGTLLCTFPSLSQITVVHDIGLVVSGFFTILLLLTWFDAFSRFPARTIVFLGGCSFLISAIGVFVILSLPVEMASIAVSAIPIISFSLLPKPTQPVKESADNRATLSRVLSEAVSWKTLLGIALSFFVIGAVGTLAPGLGVSVELSPVYLAIPASLTVFFILSAAVSPQHLDGSILFKLLLIAVATIAFLLVYNGSANLSLVFFLYITADVLLWSVLALASKKTPVAPHAVFATGWLAECLGNVLGHNVTAAMGNTTYLFALVILLILVAVGFAFGDGLFVLDLGENEQEAEESGTEPNSAALPFNLDPSPAQAVGSFGTESTTDAIAAFANRYGLSQRETDVFALWVTGHGLKYIQDTLFIGESTVKTHLRSIYRKCSTHNRAEIIALFEQ